MATAMKCDRCGRFYDKYGDGETANSLYFQNSDINGFCACDKKYDLCPNCMETVKNWVNTSSKLSVGEEDIIHAS